MTNDRPAIKIYKGQVIFKSFIYFSPSSTLVYYFTKFNALSSTGTHTVNTVYVGYFFNLIQSSTFLFLKQSIVY